MNIPRSRLLLFKVVSVLSPFVLMLLLELGLRIFGYGHSLKLFIQDPEQQDCLSFNPHASERFFTQQENATMGNSEPFKKVKPLRSKRIFVLGESTTIGYPYMHNGSFHRMLQYRLLQQYPGQQFEIINLSLTAVNSYTVWQFAKELPEYQPDAVLIYSGHNEYYGALGVASTNRIGRHAAVIQALMKLKDSRVVQLSLNTYAALLKLFYKESYDSKETLMERMAADKNIPFGSTLFQQGIRQFKDNMTEACKRLTDEKIPVFISTLVSNERDLKPFISDPKIAKSANVEFNKGWVAYRKQNFRQAKQSFTKASELDLLRFRAPAEINTSILEIIKQNKGVHLVNSRSLFETGSVHGIIDSATLLEHVHPNLKGYLLLSEAFYKALNQYGFFKSMPEVPFSFDQLQVQMPVTEVDSLFGCYSIELLKQRWPFKPPYPSLEEPKSVPARIAMDMLKRNLPWNEAMDKLMEHYRKNSDRKNMLKVAEAVLLEYPLEPAFYLTAAQLSEAMHQSGRAANYLNSAFELQPSMELARQLFTLELNADRPGRALNFIEYALKTYPADAKLNQVATVLKQIIVFQKKLKTTETTAGIRKQIGEQYRLLGNEKIAEKYGVQQVKNRP